MLLFSHSRHSQGQFIGAFDCDLTVSSSVFYNITSHKNLKKGDVVTKGDPLWQAGVIFYAHVSSLDPIQNPGRMTISNQATISGCHFELCGCFDYSTRPEDQVETGFLDGAATGFLFRKEGASVHVLNTTFASNRVCGRGGGVYLYFADYAAHNNVTILQSVFVNNSANEEGSGMAMKFVSTTVNNTVLVEDSEFRCNLANSASGTDVLFDNIWVADGVASNASLGRQHVHFRRSSWIDNRAFIASPALRVRGRYAYHVYASRVMIEDW